MNMHVLVHSWPRLFLQLGCFWHRTMVTDGLNYITCVKKYLPDNIIFVNLLQYHKSILKGQLIIIVKLLF